jgi:hypothetical protein
MDNVYAICDLAPPSLALVQDIASWELGAQQAGLPFICVFAFAWTKCRRDLLACAAP